MGTRFFFLYNTLFLILLLVFCLEYLGNYKSKNVRAKSSLYLSPSSFTFYDDLRCVSLMIQQKFIQSRVPYSQIRQNLVPRHAWRQTWTVTSRSLKITQDCQQSNHMGKKNNIHRQTLMFIYSLQNICNIYECI